MAARPARRPTPPGPLAAAGIAAAASVLMTWPLARVAHDHVLRAIYHWDAYTNAMILGSRVDGALGRGPLSWYDSYYFAPLPRAIVFNENHFGLSLLFAPFYLLSGEPLWAYNLTLLVSLGLSAFFTYLLVRRLTGSGAAGVLAGVAFAFSPYVLFEVGRIQLVATQWIPACFLCLHRAIEEQRPRDVAALWACILLQIGTCLYYAMFLIPLLTLVGVVLLYRRRPPRRLYVKLAVGGAVAAVVALGMVYPYFAVREAFDLERSLPFAAGYDGKLGFFTNVHETNLTLTFLHHPSRTRGAYEEIAFPGFTVLALLLLALGVPLGRAVAERGARPVAAKAMRWAAIAALAFAATVLSHSMLGGLLVVIAAMLWQVRSGEPTPFAGERGLYLAALLLAIALFLGISPARWGDEPIRGLYYYLHVYFPGFDGIRKVSRQAVMTTFLACVLGGFGAAWLFARIRRPGEIAVALTALLTVTACELRTFPHPVERVWAGPTVPPVYRFLATLPPEELVAVVPQSEGVGRFAGDAGMALHNYLALHHKHRFLNGQSSFTPAVTELVRRALLELPDEAAWRVLAAVGARHLLVHAEELPPRRQGLPEQLRATPERFAETFRDGPHRVFSLQGLSDPTLALLDTPALPAGAWRIAAAELRAHAELAPELAARAIDRDPETFWSGRRVQAPGQYLELELTAPRPIVALELQNRGEVMELPMSFELAVAKGGSGWRTVAERAELRLYRDQIFSPKTFVFRVVLDEPALADRVRLTVRQPVPGTGLLVREARLYAAP